MARLTRQFICQSCGTVYSKWTGKCDSCGSWNSIVEEMTDAAPIAPGGKSLKKGRKTNLVPLDGTMEEATRLPSGLEELDRVTGGGFVAGSALLVGGDPGIGKSTLLIQAAAALANKGEKVIYISGEEAIGQVRLRADRLGLSKAPVSLAAETNVEDILATLKAEGKIALVVIDSIQTLWTSAVDSTPGTVTQVRTCAQALIRFAKDTGCAVILVGHVTKDGQIAGPRVVEHMVDAVLYFVGDATHHFRILRAVKNRFGATDEIGVFEMTGDGLREVANPSALFLGDRTQDTTGVAVFAGIEGTRPLLVEIQALVAPSTLGTPRRSVLGWESNRLAMIVAVLEAHAGVRLGSHDIYLNVAGGLKIMEPGADLAVAAALVSSLTGAVIAPDTFFFGEVSLSGSVRPVAHAEIRMKEAEKLGFKSSVTPPARPGSRVKTGLARKEITDITGLVAHMATQGS